MPDNVALVIGPTGAIGGPIAVALARRTNFRVYGLSRRKPPGEAPFTHLSADLADPDSCRRALNSIAPVTHAFFAARAPFKEGGVEDVEGNVAMLQAVLDGLEARGLVVRSAGVAAFPGDDATPEAVEVAREFGADLSAHRSRPVNPELLLGATDVIAMILPQRRLTMPRKAARKRRRRNLRRWSS